MADRENEKFTQEMLAEKRPTPRRNRKMRGILILLLTLLAVLGIVVVAAYWDLNSVDSVRRLLTYSKTNSVDNEVHYVYDSDRTNQFALLGDRLLVVSTTCVSVLQSDGTAVYKNSVRFTNPAISVGGKTAALYDIGGTALYLVSEKGLLRDMSNKTDNALVSVHVSASDYLTVTTEKSGYKSSVSVYDPTGEVLFVFNSSNSYVIDAAASGDGKSVDVALLGGDDGVITSTVQRFALNEKESKAKCVLEDALLLELGTLASTTVAVTDEFYAAFSSDGSLAGSCGYAYPHLRGYTLGGGDFGALLLSRYRSGSTGRIVTVGMDGNMLASVETQHAVLSLSACGRYLAVLCDDGLTVYSPELSEYASLRDTRYARQALMRRDGTVVMLGSAEGWLYIP